MKADQLRKSILQMAIQGKLVAQNPTDEPASVLLERIQAEKQKLIKEGKLKKDKYDSIIFKGDDNRHYEKIDGKTVDIEDEIPFEIPKSWRWVRQETLCWLGNGEYTKDINLPYLEAKFLRGSKEATFVTEGIIVNIGTKIILVDGENSGEIFDVHTKGVMGSTFKILSCVSNIEKGYLLLLFDLYKDFYRNSKVGAAIPHLNKKLFKEMLVPLPPLKEQSRIIVRMKEIDPFIIEYANLEQAQNILNKELPDRLRKSILQYAIQGKLVPQEPIDEPASVLLERIRKEKEALLKQGKIKRDKADSYIYRGDDNSYYEKLGHEIKKIDDEIPFDVPDNWTWARLGNIVYNHGQITPKEDFCYIDIGSIDNNNQKLNTIENIVSSANAPSRARKIVEFGDIIYATVRPYLHNMCIINKVFSKKAIASTGFAVMACKEIIYNQFLFYYLLSPSFDQYANDNENSKGVAYPAINDEKLYKSLIPIPSLLEQQRITKSIDLLFKQIQILKN